MSLHGIVIVVVIVCCLGTANSRPRQIISPHYLVGLTFKSVGTVRLGCGIQFVTIVGRFNWKRAFVCVCHSISIYVMYKVWRNKMVCWNLCAFRNGYLENLPPLWYVVFKVLLNSVIFVVNLFKFAVLKVEYIYDDKRWKDKKLR